MLVALEGGYYLVRKQPTSGYVRAFYVKHGETTIAAYTSGTWHTNWCEARRLSEPGVRDWYVKTPVGGLPKDVPPYE